MELISKEVVRRIIDSERTKEQMLEMVESVVAVEECDDCISREAVIEILSNYGCTNKEGLLFKDIKELPSVKPKDDFEEVAEDIDMMEEDIDLACEALEEDDDCISRSEAIRIASGYCHWSRIPEEFAKLPAVKPKERTGEWIQHEEDGSYWVECSVCHSERAFGHKFCPDCGARMKE